MTDNPAPTETFADLDALTTKPVATIKLDGQTFEIHHPASLPPRELIRLLEVQGRLDAMSQDEKEQFIEEKMAYLSPQMRAFYGREAIIAAVKEARELGKSDVEIANAATAAGVKAVMMRIRFGDENGRMPLNSDQWMKLYLAITGAEVALIDKTLTDAQEAVRPANPPDVQPS